MNKKADIGFVVTAIAFFLLALILVITPRFFSPSASTTYIGEHQYTLFTGARDAEATRLYIETSARYATEDAVETFFSHSGYYLEATEFGDELAYPCGSHLSPIFSLLQDGCFPDFLSHYESYIYDEYRDYEKLHPTEELHVPLQLTLTPEEKITTIAMTTSSPLAFTLHQDENDFSQSANPIYPSFLFGTYGDEQFITCTTGNCFASTARVMYEHYSQTRDGFPYVQDGESPYTYADTLQHQNTISDSLFTGVFLSPLQPGSDEPTVPGFDSSGWIWWVGKHAGIEDFSLRKTADAYWRAARRQGSGAELICGTEHTRPCYLSTILEHAQPGDILYYGTTSQVSHMLLYLGDGMVVHSDRGKGLIQEALPPSYASDTFTAIIAVYRHSYAEEGVDETFFHDHTFSSSDAFSLIGPAFLCEDQSFAPLSDTYKERVLGPAFGVDSSLHDILIQAGLEDGVDPALIAAQAQKESSLGANNRCVASGKSSLTGCGWEPSCASGCACDYSFVVNDLTQVQCTAATTVNAYAEAITGQADLARGRYEECNAFVNEPEKMWNCMFCIYQGNYNKIIARTDPTFFTRDGTCSYAEQIKEFYCPWRSYFAQEGYAVDSSLSSTVAGQKSTLYYTPETQQEVALSFPELALVKDFAQSMTHSCKDGLEGCIAIHMDLQETDSPVNITWAQDQNDLAASILEQIYDCQTNNQVECYCDITIDQSLAPVEGLSLRFTDEQEIYTAEYGTSFFALRDPQKYGETNMLMTRSLTGEQDLHKYVELLIPQEGAIRLDSEDTGSDYRWELPPSGKVYLLKTTEELLWSNPETELDPHLFCRDTKKHYPLQAQFTSMEQDLNFTLELEDTTAPRLLAVRNDELYCQGQVSILLQWSTPLLEEKNYAFRLSFADAEKDFYFLDARAEQPKGNPAAGVLYRYIDQGQYHYTVLLTHHPSGTPLRAKNYSLQLTSYDHYLNAENSSFRVELTLPEEDEDEVATLLSPLPQLQSLFPDASFCTISNYVLVGQDATTPENYGLLFPEKPLSYARSIPTTSSPQNTNGSGFVPQLYVLPNGSVLRDQLYNEPVYSFAGIPNIVCDESDTRVRFSDPSIPGKICGGSKELVEQLHYLATDFLVPNDYRIFITQAYRTYEIQNFFYDEYINKNGAIACNPNPRGKKFCSHMISGAIDLNLQRKNSQGQWYKASNNEQERVLCQYSFIRYARESWHFEYGTSRWKAGMEAGVCAI